MPMSESTGENYKYLSEEYDASDPFHNGGEASVDPFEGNPAAGLNFIMLSRIYDVLMAQLRVSSPDTARDLLASHMSGLLLGPTPWMNGQFVTDILNSDEEVLPSD